MMWDKSVLKDMAAMGEALAGEYVVDVHTHLGGPNNSVDDMIREMDRLGVNTAVTFHGITSDFVYGNDAVTAAINNFPDRLVGLAIVNPHYRTEVETELERSRANGLRGIKIIADYQRYPSDGPNLFPAFEYAHEHGWIILSHDWGQPAFLDNLATTFSNACFIVGRFTPLYADLITSHDNIFQCTTGSVHFGDIKALTELIPADKIVFGSDYPNLPIMFSMGPILYSRIDDDDKRKIIGLNARGILERWPGK
ncbi:MAG: amidohydrolase family protein [Armatimonadota bacterium]